MTLWIAKIGPVVFPMPPNDGPMETSGVVIGASGFGFVPGASGASKLMWKIS